MWSEPVVPTVSQRISESRMSPLLTAGLVVLALAVVLTAGYYIRQYQKSITPGSINFAAVAQNTNCDANCVQTIAGSVNACKGQLDIIERVSVIERVFNSYRGDNFTETEFNIEARCIDSKVVTAKWVVYGIKANTPQ
jgi:hypothetical protein